LNSLQDRLLNDGALIERFLEMMSAEAGAARNTIAAYRSDLALASDYLEYRLGEAAAADLSRLGEHWRELSRSSVARKSAALRRFFAFLVDEGLRRDRARSARCPRRWTIKMSTGCSQRSPIASRAIRSIPTT
jgi:integrase/recombinase XerD